MTSPTILTIVLNYRTADMTLKATEAARIAMQDLPGEILIVDNDSQDGSFETMQTHVAEQGWGEDGHVRVMQSGHNGGYGAGNNAGIRMGLSDGSRADYIYVLNSDAFPDPDAIRVLYDYMNAHPKVGFAGSYLKGRDGVKHTSTFRFPSLFSEFESALRLGVITRLLKNHRVPNETLDHTAEVDWMAGASLMMRQDVLDEIGLFDETFFLYFEETDLSRRARKSGYKIVYVHDSVVTHWGSVSTGMNKWSKMPTYWYDSRWYYFSKNHGVIYAMAATVLHLLAGSLNWIRCKLTGRHRNIAPGFLRTLAAHDMQAIWRRIFPVKAQPDALKGPQIGE